MSHTHEELEKRDKLNLDLFWIKDRTLTDADALPAPDILAQEIADDLEAALEQFTKIAARLGRLGSGASLVAESSTWLRPPRASWSPLHSSISLEDPPEAL